MSVYGPDLDLANRLRRWLNPIGVTVVEIDGWRVRGRTYATFNPYGSVNHHTAGGLAGVAPSLGICINGRSDLPGPLCNAHQQRNDVVNCVAAGVANHAGPGSFRGMSGNQSVWGLEVEHTGTSAEPFPERRWETSCRVHAAFLSGLDRPNTELLAQHFEWSTMGKIDFYRPALPGGADGFRARVAQLLATGPGGAPPPPPKPPEDVLKLHFAKLEEADTVYVVGMGTPPRAIEFFDDARWWATVEGIILTEEGGDKVLGADAAGKTAKGIIIGRNDKRARSLFGFIDNPFET